MTFPANVEGGFLSRLFAAAGRSPNSAAILHSHRGRRIVYSWRDVVAEADRLASSFSLCGLCRDNAIVVEGEITPRLLIAAAAARAVGARVISAPPQSDAVACAAILGDSQAAAVLVQSREAAEKWSDSGRGVAIVLDHVTAGGHGAAISAVETLDALRKAAQPAGWAAQLPRDRSIFRSGRPIWVEETTAWRGGVDVILERWITEVAALALPELLAAADRDRREAAPKAWIVSAGRLEAAVNAFRLRLPEPSTLTGKLVARALEAPSAMWARPLVALIRRRLGLGAVTAIELYEDAATPSMAAPRQWLAVLGIAAADQCKVLHAFEETAVDGVAS